MGHRSLPTLELTTFKQQVCSTKIGYANALSLRTNSHKKKEYGRFQQRASSHKSNAHLTVVGLNDNREVYIASSKFSEPMRFVRRLNTVEGKYIQ